MRQLKIIKKITNREYSLDKYLQEIGVGNPLLSPDEEVALAKQIHEGDQEAMNKLVKANLRFVVSVAKHYQNQGLQLSDLINIGNRGLIKAAERFDPTRGFKFISYAVWWIRQSILQALAEESRPIRIPLNRAGFLSKVLKASALLEQKLQRNPTPQEIADHLSSTPEEINNTLQLASRHVSLDAPFVQGEENTLLEVLPDDQQNSPEKELLNDSLKGAMHCLLDKLSDRKKRVIIDFFGIAYTEEEKQAGRKLGMTLDAIAKKMGLTRERVRQIKEKAIKELLSMSNTVDLKSYLGGD